LLSQLNKANCLSLLSNAVLGYPRWLTPHLIPKGTYFLRSRQSPTVRQYEQIPGQSYIQYATVNFRTVAAGTPYSFAALLKPIVETVDQFGLKARHLHKHRKSVARFYEALAQRDYQTEPAVGYRRRFEKYRDRLCTFLGYDGIPWNNNNAEHAIKAFARLRNVIGTNSTAKSMRDYLVLLSVAETCKCKGLNFLDFLRSGSTEIEGFEGPRSIRSA
jgi:hypothetical protein